MLLIGYSLGATLARFDNPTIPESGAEKAVALAASALLWPGRVLWTAQASRSLPNAAEWIVFLLNSAVWGVCLGWLSTRLIWRR